MATVDELLRSGSDLPGDSPRRDAEILLGHCLNKPRSWLYTWPDFEPAAEETQQFQALLEQRRAGHPVAYLTGERGFWTLNLRVDNATLIPRPETETLIEWALELPLPDAIAALDLGTGSGAIALALASERPAWQVSAVDSSSAALDIARSNAQRNSVENVQFVRSNWFDALVKTQFDLIVANPPYIDAQDPHLLSGDVRFEPRSALVADGAGLADLVHIIAQSPVWLTSGGWLLVEHGYDQGEAVRNLFQEAQFCQVMTRRDLGGQERITSGQWHAHR